MDVFDRLKAATADDWQSYVDHDFVRQMGAGTLPQAASEPICRTICS
jgi:thiaminase/transcriptional activator TenA